MIRVTNLKFPKEVSIGGMVYTIVVMDNLRSDEGAKLDGWIVYGQNEIRLDSHLGEQARWQVMIHEIIHGILTQAGQEFKEEVVDAVAYGILGLVQGNQWEVKDVDNGQAQGMASAEQQAREHESDLGGA